jgi:type I restriction enzyme S subunit
LNKLTTYKFAKLYDFSSGISSKPEQAGHGSPFASFSTVFNHYFLPNELNDLMDTSEKVQETYSIKKGDILLTRTSETVDELAMSCVAIKDYPNATYSGFVKRLRPLQNDITYDKFMGFYLRSKLFRKTMTNNAVMTLRASLNEQIFSYLDLVLPSYNEQVKIGDLLHLINQKIELNNKINKELESISKTLYDYWFVQFDFPNSNGKPYKSSGGKMVYNEELKREIPDGFKVGCIGDYCKSTGGFAFKSSWWTSLGVSVIKIKDIKEDLTIDLSNLSKVNLSDKKIDDKFKARAGNILIAMTGATVGKYSIVPITDNPIYINQRVGYFDLGDNPTDNLAYFINSLNQQYFREMIFTLANGAAQPNISNEQINNILLLIPNKIIIEKFNKKLSAFYKIILINQQKNQKLTELRDWLLPMLMNGQVSIKDDI